ncbi:MAG: hypothetical protein LBB47_05185 [Spirochaetaceae bacterium]|jgi:hypothetical protein|nr:hypothetical protein [Spirochaetaceae bacterium]
MNYDEIDVEKEVWAVYDTMDRGAFRPATKKETQRAGEFEPPLKLPAQWAGSPPV